MQFGDCGVGGGGCSAGTAPGRSGWLVRPALRVLTLVPSPRSGEGGPQRQKESECWEFFLHPERGEVRRGALRSPAGPLPCLGRPPPDLPLKGEEKDSRCLFPCLRGPSLSTSWRGIEGEDSKGQPRRMAKVSMETRIHLPTPRERPPPLRPPAALRDRRAALRLSGPRAVPAPARPPRAADAFDGDLPHGLVWRLPRRSGGQHADRLAGGVRAGGVYPRSPARHRLARQLPSPHPRPLAPAGAGGGGAPAEPPLAGARLRHPAAVRSGGWRGSGGSGCS